MKKGILLVAFGSSNAQADHTLRRFDAQVRESFAGINVRWAFSSLLLRERLAKVRVKRDSVVKALQKMYFEKYTHVAVQPLQTIPGQEHHTIIEEVHKLTQGLTNFTVRVGAPLLQEEHDIQKTAHAIVRHVPEQRMPQESVVLLGHGAEHNAVQRYADLAQYVYALDKHIHIGTMCNTLPLENIIPILSRGHKVWLMPLLSVIGQHALKDMAGKQKSSWRKRIEAAGYLCEPVLHGLAEYEGFMEIWLEHLKHTMQQYNGEKTCVHIL